MVYFVCVVVYSCVGTSADLTRTQYNLSSSNTLIILTAVLATMAPQLQKPAPEFAGTAVVNGQFKDIKLSDYKGKYVVLFFYPLDL